MSVTSSSLRADAPLRSDTSVGPNESAHSAVSWAAVLGGAFVASSISLILIALGSGLGLSSISPWSNSGISATAFGIGAIVWLLLTQLISAGLGGYLAGRLRTRWVGVHTDEVFFRDTAHGFLVWAVGAVISAALLTSAAGSLVSGATQAGATVLGATGAAAAGTAASQVTRPADPTAYFTDMMMRSDSAPPDANGAAANQEVARIMTTSLAQGDVSNDDRAYLAKVVAARTGLSAADAQQRVDNVIGQAKAQKAKAELEAKQAADAARKTAAHVSLWLFISLLAGAFVASFAATVGGRTRDLMTPVPHH